MPMDSPGVIRERNEENGRWEKTYPRERFVDVLRDHGPAGTSTVEEAVGCSYHLAYERLRELEEQGRVTSTRVGNARLWEVADE